MAEKRQHGIAQDHQLLQTVDKYSLTQRLVLADLQGVPPAGNNRSLVFDVDDHKIIRFDLLTKIKSLWKLFGKLEFIL